MGGEHLMNRYKTKSEFEVYFNLLMLKKYESMQYAPISINEDQDLINESINVLKILEEKS